MWRFLLLALSAAALGSLISTVGVSLLSGGSGAPEPGQFVFGFAAAAMIFTFPGAIMLIGFQEVLVGRGHAGYPKDVFVVLFGAFAGAMILAFVSVYLAEIGAFYGCITGVALVCLQRFLPKSESS